MSGSATEVLDSRKHKRRKSMNWSITPLLNLMPIILAICAIYGLVIVRLRRENENFITTLQRLYFSKKGFALLFMLTIYSGSRNLNLTSPISAWVVAGIVGLIFTFFVYSIWILIKRYILKSRDLIIDQQLDGINTDDDNHLKPEDKEKFMGNPPFTKCCVFCKIYYDETWKVCFSCGGPLVEKAPDKSRVGGGPESANPRLMDRDQKDRLS